jgi:hypothetical protein
MIDARDTTPMAPTWEYIGGHSVLNGFYSARCTGQLVVVKSRAVLGYQGAP